VLCGDLVHAHVDLLISAFVAIGLVAVLVFHCSCSNISSVAFERACFLLSFLAVGRSDGAVSLILMRKEIPQPSVYLDRLAIAEDSIGSRKWFYLEALRFLRREFLKA